MKFWEEELPTPTAMLAELKEWVAHVHWEKRPAQSHPVSLLGCLQHADEDQFPNVKQVLCIGCTLPAESADAKRSFSTFRRIKTYLRSRRSQDRLLRLALMHVHYGLHVDTKEICQKYNQTNRRMMFLSSVIRQSLDWRVCLTSELYSIDEFTSIRGKLVHTV